MTSTPLTNIDPGDITAVICEDDDPALNGLWLRMDIQMRTRDPDPVVRRLQEMIMGRARQQGAIGKNWRVADEATWGQLMLRCLVNDKRVKVLG